MEENMMATEVMEQMAENTVDAVVSSEKSGNCFFKIAKYVGIGYVGKKVYDIVDGVVCKISPKVKAKKIKKLEKKLEKLKASQAVEQPELNSSDFDVNENDFE